MTSSPSPTAPAPKRPVAPRDAASLVLVRRGSTGPEVLLGRRAGRHRFLPNMYAFPGGGVDQGDRSEMPVKLLKYREDFYRPFIGCEPGLAQALAVAAIRETWEETGIALGRLENGRLRPDLSGLTYLCRAITPADSPIRFHARFFLQDVTGRDFRLGGSGNCSIWLSGRWTRPCGCRWPTSPNLSSARSVNWGRTLHPGASPSGATAWVNR